MSINIWTDSMQHAALLGKPVLFTNWLIQRDIIPDGWYCYDLRGTHKSPSTRTTLVDHAADYHAGTVLSPIPLKHEGTASRRVNGTFYLLGEEMTLEQFCEEHDLAYPQDNREFVLRPASLDEVGLFYSEEKLDEALGNHRHYQYALAGLTPSEYYTYVTTRIYPVDNYYGIKATELMPIQALIAARRRAAEEKAKKYREASAKKRAMAQGKKKDPEFVIARDQRILRREIAKWTRSKELALQQISHLREILELSQKARAYLMTASADLILQLYNGENWGAHPELAYIYKMRELF